MQQYGLLSPADNEWLDTRFRQRRRAERRPGGVGGELPGQRPITLNGGFRILWYLSRSLPIITSLNELNKQPNRLTAANTTTFPIDGSVHPMTATGRGK